MTFPELPGLPKPPGFDRLDPFHDGRHDPVQDIIHSVFEPGANLNLFERGHGPNVRSLPIMEIVDQVHRQIERDTVNFFDGGRGLGRNPMESLGRALERDLFHRGHDTYHDRYPQAQDRYANPRSERYDPSTSRELMDTLDRHKDNINFYQPGKPTISKNDLRDYLQECHNQMSSRDLKDLTNVLANFDLIGINDGNIRNGISGRDMDTFLARNQNRDNNIERSREVRNGRNGDRTGDPYQDLRDENQRLREELARMRGGQPGGDGGNRPGDGRNQPGDNRIRYPNDRVITQTDPSRNNHFHVDGENIGLSQEEFKRFYNIPQEVDLLKFMNGKPNDGKVVDFWQAGVTDGLGGRKDDNSLKWNDPNYHTLKYDFSRNFQQVFQYTQGMNEQQAKQFAFNFARTQLPVFQANGFALHKVENETVTSTGEGQTGTIDFVRDIGDPKMKIQW